MANVLPWLTGREDQTPDPSPLMIDSSRLLARDPLDLGPRNPSLTAYYPSPSERFSSWVSELLGAGPGASLARQNFATGVPSLLQATPLGMGLSAADFAHAKAANDPVGTAAAAIGMMPGVGPEGRAAFKGAKNVAANTAKGGVDDLEKMMTDLLGPIGSPPKLLPPKNDTDVALSAIHEALNPGQALPDWMAPKAVAKSPSFDYEKDDTGLYHIFDATSGKTHAIVNTPNEAKVWIAKQQPTGKPLDLDPEYPSSPISPKNGAQTRFDTLGPFPSYTPFKPSETAVASGYVTPAVHGTRIGPSIWETPSGGAVGESGDALRLPADELGVHFGTPDQAKEFTGKELSSSSFVSPRTYPTVLQTGKSLELPDTGVWHVGDIKTALLDLNKGKSPGGEFALAEPKAHVGEFPSEEHAHITTIEELREYLQNKGYDSVNYINRVEGKGQRSHIMFKPSPENPKYAAGVRSPFAAFDPAKMARPELAAGLAGATTLPFLMQGDQKQ